MGGFERFFLVGFTWIWLDLLWMSSEARSGFRGWLQMDETTDGTDDMDGRQRLRGFGGRAGEREMGRF